MKIELDVHTHTIASGHAFSTLQEMAHAAAEKGLKVLGITEHSPGIPGSCDPIYFRNLHVVPRQMYGIELLLGAEINILDGEGNLDSAPIKRMIQDSRERGLLVDASYGRKTKSVLVTDGGYLFLSALTPETVAARAGSVVEGGDEEDAQA